MKAFLLVALAVVTLSGCAVRVAPRLERSCYRSYGEREWRPAKRWRHRDCDHGRHW